MVQGVDLVAQQMNTVINDYGDITLAVGAEGSLARFKCEHPKMIKELLAEIPKETPSAWQKSLVSYSITTEFSKNHTITWLPVSRLKNTLACA